MSFYKKRTGKLYSVSFIDGTVGKNNIYVSEKPFRKNIKTNHDNL